MRITFIGGGNMGEAMLSSIIEKGLAPSGDIYVSDIAEERLAYLEKKYGVAVTTDKLEAVKDADIIVLAVKPQHLAGPMKELKGRLEPSRLVLSIIAGSTIKTLTGGLGHSRVVRVMPNTPAQIGMGMSVWTATPEVTAEQKEMAGSVLSAIGRQIFVEDEKYLDMATAVSGSGPAYFFLFVEALVEAAEKVGFTKEAAMELVLQTMLGSGHLIEKSDKTPAELREMVTSKGGTTAAALDELEKGKFRELVGRAVEAALERARVLGGEQK